MNSISLALIVALPGSCTLFSSIAVHAQCGQYFFTRVIVGAGSDHGHSPLVLSNGDIIVPGYSDSYAGTGLDITIVRFDQYGVPIWAKAYDLLGDDGGLSITMAECSNGDLLLAGQVNGVDPFGSGTEKGLIMRLDSAGQIQWARRIGSSGYWQARAIREAANGDVLFCGSQTQMSNGSTDSFVGRMSAGGALYWIRSYGSGGNDHWSSMHELPGGDLVVTQGSYTGIRQPWMARLDPSGMLVGSWIYASTTVDDTFLRSCMNADGTFLHVGYTSSYGTGGRNIMAILTDDLGSVIWSTVFSYPGMDNGMNAVQTTDMGWVIGGKLGMDACLIKLASNGNMEWSAVYPEINPSASTIWADLVATHPDGGFVISSNGAGANADDMIVVKVDSCGWACSYAPVGLVQSFPTIAVSSGPTAPSGTLLTTNVQSWSTYDLLPTIVASLLEPCDPQCWIDLEQVPLVACVGVPVAICPGTNSATSGANSWSWDLGDGTTSTAPGSVMHVYASAGVYTVSVTATDTVNGCADTLQMAVTVSEPADAGLDGLVRVCPNAPLVDLFAQLGGSPFPAGQWSGPGGSPSNGWWNPALDPTGFYSYVVQASSGCPDTSRVFVDLFPGAFAGPDTSFTLCTGSGVVDLDLLLAAWASAAGTWRDPSGSQVPNGLVDAATAPSGAYVYIDATQFCADSAVYDILFDICSGLSDLHFAGGMSAWWLDDDHLVFLCPMDLQSALLELTITDLLGRIILKRDVGWSREPTTLALGRGRNMSCTILRLFDPTSQRSATVVLLPHH